MRALAALVALALSIWLLSNCQSIIGVKDYTYTAVNPECGNYCDLARDKCPSSMGTYSSIYTTRDSCIAVCNQLDPSQTINANTLGCRENLLNGGEPMDCPKAGPGGGDQCGSNCDSYCSLYGKICPTQFNKEFGNDSSTSCADACSALPDTKSYNAVNDATGATVQCRLSHLSTAATEGTNGTDCSQVGLRPADKCTDEPGSDPFCNNFCTYAINACPGELAIYENRAQCLAVCKALPPGTEKTDISHNTMICRAYHISNVFLIGRALHCPHIGPGGDGHCGPDDVANATGNCESYCILREKACPDPAGDAGAESRAQCEQECSTSMIPGVALNSGYTVNPPPDAGANSGAPVPGTLQCRLLHLARALEHPNTRPADCNAALGNGECAAPAAN